MREENELSETQLGVNTEVVGMRMAMISKTLSKSLITISDCSPLQDSTQVKTALCTVPEL